MSVTPGPLTLGGRIAAAEGERVIDLRKRDQWQRVGVDWCITHSGFRIPNVDRETERCRSWDHDDTCDDISGSDHEEPGDRDCSPCEFRPLAYRKDFD